MNSEAIQKCVDLVINSLRRYNPKKQFKVYIVSRHKAFIDYIKEYFPFAEVISHIDNPEKIQKHSVLIGNVPLDLMDYLINERKCKIFVSYFAMDRFKLKEYFKKYDGDFPLEFVKKYVRFRRVKSIEIQDKMTMEDIAQAIIR